MEKTANKPQHATLSHMLQFSNRKLKL